MLRHGIIPSAALNLSRHYEHHKVVGSCIEVEKMSMGCKAEIINRRHVVTLIVCRVARFAIRNVTSV